jgi:hypothetical protein
MNGKNQIQNYKQTVNYACKPECRREIRYKSHVCIELDNIKSPANDQAAYIKSISLNIEGRQKLQIGKTQKERSQENSEEGIYGGIVNYSPGPNNEKVQNGSNGIPYSACKKSNS